MKRWCMCMRNEAWSCAALPRTSVLPKTIIAFCRYIADHTAVTMIATSNTQKRPWPTVCTHGGCNTPWWHDGVPAKHSVGMRVTSEEKPRQAATVMELMAEQQALEIVDARAVGRDWRWQLRAAKD